MARRRSRREISARPDEQLHDERVWRVRPGRLATGGAMIVIAIIWLVLDNIYGVHEKPISTQPAKSPAITVPSLGTQQPFKGGLANARLLGREGKLGGQTAPAGHEYLIISVEVINQGSSRLPVAPATFTLGSAEGVSVPGTAVPDHGGFLTTTGIAAGERATGDLYWLVTTGRTPRELRFTPPVAGAHPIVWAVP